MNLRIVSDAVTSKSTIQPRREVWSAGAARLGSEAFRRDFGLRYAYVAGAMYRGISSEDLVIALGRAGCLGFFGAGGLDRERIDSAITYMQRVAEGEFSYGVNLVHRPDAPHAEDELVDLLLARRVRFVEASAFMQVTPALIRYRAKGLRSLPDGSIAIENRVFGKVSRPEVALRFLEPAPERTIAQLLASGGLTEEEARLVRRVPLADALTVEGDSAGHTDKGVLLALLPAILALRDQVVSARRYPGTVHVGAAGGLGAPGAIAAAFALGADYVLTGSVNQCTVESGASDAVKNLLQAADVQDVAMAPAGDMFEIGARVQVLRRGTMFAARANKLHDVYTHHEALETLGVETKAQIEEKILKASLDEVLGEVERYFSRCDPLQLNRARNDPKHRMALVFRWYFARSTQLAADGNPEHQADYQIHCGPAMGSFNAVVRGTELEPWPQRGVAQVARFLMEGAACRLWMLRDEAPARDV